MSSPMRVSRNFALEASSASWVCTRPTSWSGLPKVRWQTIRTITYFSPNGWEGAGALDLVSTTPAGLGRQALAATTTAAPSGVGTPPPDRGSGSSSDDATEWMTPGRDIPPRASLANAQRRDFSRSSRPARNRLWRKTAGVYPSNLAFWAANSWSVNTPASRS
jgi:hypothetical protein